MNSKLLTTTLDIDSITSERLRKEFDETELERLAKAIISSGGIINPILVREISPIKYDVIEGHFEYYAAVKASEIEPTFAEIRAIVLSKDLEFNEGIREQIDILRKKEFSTTKDIPSISEQYNKSDYGRLEKLLLDRFCQLETKLNSSLSVNFDIRQIEELFNKHEERIISLEKCLLDRLSTLEDKIQHLIPPSPPKICINSASKKELEKISGLGPASSKKIIERRKTNPFKNIDEVFECCKVTEKNKKTWREIFVFD